MKHCQADRSTSMMQLTPCFLDQYRVAAHVTDSPEGAQEYFMICQF